MFTMIDKKQMEIVEYFNCLLKRYDRLVKSNRKRCISYIQYFYSALAINVGDKETLLQLYPLFRIMLMLNENHVNPV